MSTVQPAFPTLDTARLRLRLFTPHDLDALAQIFGNPAVMRHLGPVGAPMDREESEKALVSIIAHWQQHGIGRWAVEDKELGRLIGYGGLRWFEHAGEGPGRPELVYLLDEPYWGRGLATELARACLKFGFVHRGFGEIVAMTKPGNSPSRHILSRKLRMRRVGKGSVFGIEVVRYVLSRAEYVPDGEPVVIKQSIEPPYTG